MKKMAFTAVAHSLALFNTSLFAFICIIICASTYKNTQYAEPANRIRTKMKAKHAANTPSQSSGKYLIW